MDSAQADSAPPAASSPLSPADRLIVALDLPSANTALDLVDELQGLCRWF
jgi:orotidine-5'-phosphate decarboxylase